jgi:DNA repair protein RadC
MLNLADPSHVLPREKLEALGARSLTDDELLAIIITGGSATKRAERFPREALGALDPDLEVDVKNLKTRTGLAATKCCVIAAALEFARRRIRPEGIKIKRASDVMPLLTHLLNRPQEHVVCISLNGAHEVLRMRTVGVGLLTSCPVHPREVFAGPLGDRAYSVILAHNHPSGATKPSQADIDLTKKLVAGGKIMEICVLDHLIIGDKTYLSFADEGML